MLKINQQERPDIKTILTELETIANKLNIDPKTPVVWKYIIVSTFIK